MDFGLNYKFYLLSMDQPTEEQVRAYTLEHPDIRVSGQFASRSKLKIYGDLPQDWSFWMMRPVRFDRAKPPFDKKNPKCWTIVDHNPRWQTEFSVPRWQVEGEAAVLSAFDVAYRLAWITRGKLWDPNTEICTPLGEYADYHKLMA
jgi:hypothetical protein